MLALALASLASLGLEPKALSGPPSSFMELPQFEHAAVSSRAQVYVVKSKSSSLYSERIYTHRFEIATAGFPFVSVAILPGEAAIQAGAAQFSVSGPLHVKNPDKVVAGQRLGVNKDSHGYVAATFDSPEIGIWKVDVKIPNALAPPEIMIMVTIGGDTRLWTSLDTHQFTVGGEVPITGKILGGDANGQMISLDEECRVIVDEPGGSKVHKKMQPGQLPPSHYLFRKHNQTEAFQTSITTQKAGLYTVKVESRGSVGIRHSFHSFRVVDRNIRLEGRCKASWVARKADCQMAVEKEQSNLISANDIFSSHTIALQIPVHSDKAGSYRVYTEVWAHKHTRSSTVPVAWVSRMVSVPAGRSTVTLHLDPRWVRRAKAWVDAKRALVMRNLRFEDAQNFIPVLEVEELTTQTTNITINIPIAESAENISITGIMLEGCISPTANLSAASRAAGTIALVHGYCAGGNPFGTSGWGAHAAFSDPSQSRPVDDFAQRIGSFLASTGATSIAAHSMGGMASLHLAAYYQSNLDFAAGGRVIQSVGTPYGGCPLAGLLASIGNIFGTGCGSNNDLTYDGATRWLAGIPASARSKVYYYYTYYDDSGGFPYLNNYCVLAANAILEWPNDGVVEVTRAVLNGGNLVQVRMGECHTEDMNYPSQTLNAAQNKEISENRAW